MNWVWEIGIAICMVIGTFGAMVYFVMNMVMRRIQEVEQNKDQQKKLEKRLNTLEKQMKDTQDIVISIDDQLKRSSDNKTTTPTLRELS